ncbi:MAG TPA: hypothetical protein VLA89_14145 [Gemmatimonadales bacterium]|nr:hypothetical protein [Gemmatimonadales bacterium]
MSENENVEYSFLDRDEILDFDDIKIHVVPVPEWSKPGQPPAAVRLKVLSAAERDEFEASTVTNKGGKQKPNLANLRARLVARCMVDGDGKRVFVSGDVVRLGHKSSAALDRLFAKCQEINGFSEKDIEEMTEDFDGTRD